MVLVLSLEAGGAQVSAPSYDYQPRPDPAPRTLQHKVRDARLIVFGTASAFGGTPAPPISGTTEFYKRNLRVNIAAVLWPPTLTNMSEAVFPYSFLPGQPRSQWDYSNTAGVFFLTTNSSPQRGEWDRLPFFDDWWERPTNLIAVLACIGKEKGTPCQTGLLHIPSPPPVGMSQYARTPAASDYESGFREGYLAALVGRGGFWTFGPTNEADKAKVIGYADGQLAGHAAWSGWLSKHQQK